MDIHSFDEYIDLRDQQDEGHPPQQSASPEKSAVTTTTTMQPTTTTPTSTSTSWSLGSSSNEALDNPELHHDPNFFFSLAGSPWEAVFAGLTPETLQSYLQQQQQVLAQHQHQQQQPQSSQPQASNMVQQQQQQTFIPPHVLMPPSFNTSNTSTENLKQEEPAKSQDEKTATTINAAAVAATSSAENQAVVDEEDDGRMKTRASNRKRSAGNQSTEENQQKATTKKRSRSKKLYCICQQPYTGDPMVQCDACHEWFHCACVDLDPELAEDIETWVCKKCEESQKTVPPKEEVKTRQSKTRKCLLPTCQNTTRADSYCSDTCAAADALRKSGDSEYVPPASNNNTSSSHTRSTSGELKRATKTKRTKAHSESPPPTPTTSATSFKQDDEAIRKNVVKNLANILKTIILNGMDKDPSLFSDSGAAKDTKESQAQEMAENLAKAIEQSMYDQLAEPHPSDKQRLTCGNKYKGKFRSLLPNLKDKANEVFQLRVVTGEITPDELIKMSSEDMANPELKSMSESLRQKSIKNSVLKLQHMPIIKKTHKGDIIMIPSREENRYEEKEQLTPEVKKQRPISINTNNNTDARSSSSSSSSSGKPTSVNNANTPSTPTTATTNKSVDDILALMGIGLNDKRPGNDNGEREKKRKKTNIDVEALLGDDDFQLEVTESGLVERRRRRSEDMAVDEEQQPATPPLPPQPPKPPTIWHGRVNMPQVTDFEAIARQIGGRTLSEAEWADVLSPTMWIEGRIPIDRVTNYITQTQYSHSKEIVLLEIEAVQGDQNMRNAGMLLNYFETRMRYGVVGHNKTKIKDFYLIPLYRTQQLPDCLYVVRIEETQRDVDMFLGVLVIHKQQQQQQQADPRIPYRR